MNISGKEVDRYSLSVAGIKLWDAPDYVDAYFDSGTFIDGKPLNDLDLMILSEKYPNILHEVIQETLN